MPAYKRPARRWMEMHKIPPAILKWLIMLASVWCGHNLKPGTLQHTWPHTFTQISLCDSPLPWQLNHYNGPLRDPELRPVFLQLRKLSLSRVRRVQLTGSLQPAKNGGGGCFLLCENVRRANKNRTVAINGGWRRQRIRLKALEAIMKVNITLRIFHPSCSSLVTACKGVRHLATLTHTWGGYPGPIVLKKKKGPSQAGRQTGA